MTNPVSTRRAFAADRQQTPSANPRRRRVTRVLPAVSALTACLLLATAAAADGQSAALLLALWVGVLVVIGLRLSEPRRNAPAPRTRVVRRPVLVLAEMGEDGELGTSRTLPVVASPTAIAVLDSRPTG